MKIDRQRFLSLVLGMTSPLVGCGGASQSEPVATTPAVSVSVSVSPSVAPTVACVDWSPSGQCLAYGQVASAPTAEVAPTAEIAPTAEVAPTAECYGWDDNGTCVEWTYDENIAPVDECVQYDPTGECTAWS